MSILFRPTWNVFFPGILFLLSIPYAYANVGAPLFTLERPTNKNQVIYELQMEPGEKTAAHIHPYWKMRAGDGHLEELTSFEKSHAYGVQEVQSDDPLQADKYPDKKFHCCNLWQTLAL